MTENRTPLKTTSTLVSAMHDIHIAIILLDADNQVIQMNSVASQWFGATALQGTQFNNQWLAEKHVRLKNGDQESVDSNIWFSKSPEPFCIETKQHSIWVSCQRDSIQWHGQDATALLLTDISPVMNELIQLRQQTANADIRDPLTELPNRRYALERMQQMHIHGKRYGGQFTIALIDIDHFKRINDTYGQSLGDGVIARIATILKSTLRETDFCARYGGEEYLVLMPETSMMDAVITLDRLRQQVSELKWENMTRPITVSAGVYMWQRNKSVEQLLFQTDQRLTMAKNAGRNQVCGDLT
jgi:diguanylate cyclase (GGDEF)-like protein